LWILSTNFLIIEKKLTAFLISQGPI